LPVIDKNAAGNPRRHREPGITARPAIAPLVRRQSISAAAGFAVPESG